MPENNSDSIKIISTTSANTGSTLPSPAAASAPGNYGSSSAAGLKLVDPPASPASPKVDAKPAMAAPINLGAIEKSDSKPEPFKTGGPSDLASFFSKPSAKQAETKIIESVVAQKPSEKVKPILGSAPNLQKALDEEKEFKLKRRLRASQIIFLTVFFCCAGMVAYFYSELAPGFNLFGANTTARLTEINNNLRSTQRSINRDNILAAQLALNEFSFVSDQYLDATSRLQDKAISDAERQNLMILAGTAAENMPQIVEKIRSFVSKELVVPTVRSESEVDLGDDQMNAQQEVKSALSEYKSTFLNSQTGDLNLDQIRIADNAIKLVGNKPLIGTIKNVSTDKFKKDLQDNLNNPDPDKRQQIKDLVASILSSTTSDIATIAAIKSSRMDWLKIIKQIEEETIKVDKNFDPSKPLLSESNEITEGLEYSGFQLEALTDNIVLTGEIKTKNATNFTWISTLIKTFEESEHFKDVEMRSFSKNGDDKTGYTASFQITLKLETDSEAKAEKISLVKKIMAVKAGKKRINSFK